jgi:hypothetical protein
MASVSIITCNSNEKVPVFMRWSGHFRATKRMNTAGWHRLMPLFLLALVTTLTATPMQMQMNKPFLSGSVATNICC